MIFNVHELKAVVSDQFISGMTMLAQGAAERVGRSPDDFEVRNWAGALVGVVLTALVSAGQDPPATCFLDSFQKTRDTAGVMTHQRSPVQERLRSAGLRITAPRVAVLEWLAGHPHTTAEQVAAGIRQRLGSVSTQAVYDVLGAVTRASLVRRIEPAGHPARFETRAGDNHHHLVCRACGRTEDVDCVSGSAPCLEPSDTVGFQVDEAEVVFWGLCVDCVPQDIHHNEEATA